MNTSKGVGLLNYLEFRTNGSIASIHAGKTDGEPTDQQLRHVSAVPGWWDLILRAGGQLRGAPTGPGRRPPAVTTHTEDLLDTVLPVGAH